MIKLFGFLITAGCLIGLAGSIYVFVRANKQVKDLKEKAEEVKKVAKW